MQKMLEKKIGDAVYGAGGRYTTYQVHSTDCLAVEGAKKVYKTSDGSD